MSPLLAALYLALPAFVANMMPVIAAKIGVGESLACPIDGGRMLHGHRLLGDHKTWRGVIAAVVGSVAVVLVQYALALEMSIVTSAYDSLLIALAYGVIVGLLVMLGDAIGSVVKRRLHVASGKPLIPLDQTDYILAFIIGTLPFTAWPLVGATLLVFITFFANLGANALAYIIGIKNTYW